MSKPFNGDYILTQGFGLNPTDYSQFGLKGHNGLDYALPMRTEVLAPHDGKVIEATLDPKGYGLYIKIENDKEGSVLAHFAELRVGVGDIVKEGQLIAYSDTSGNSTGPHLHWGYYQLPRDRTNGYAGFIDQLPLLFQNLLDKMREQRDDNWDLYLSFKDAGFTTIDDVVKAIEEKQTIIRAVDGFRVALTKSLGIEGSDWQRILDEVNKTIKEKDDTFEQAKVGDTLWDAIVGQSGVQTVKYTSEGVKALVDSLELLKKAVPEGFRLLSEEEYTQLTARKTLDRFDKWELFVEFLRKFFK